MARLSPIDPARFTPSRQEAWTPSTRGGPGAAPPDATVVVINLATTDAPTRTLASANGEFSFTLSYAAGDELRFWAEKDGLRSPPLDLLALGMGGPWAEVVNNSCLQLHSELFLQSGKNPLLLSNSCSTDVTVTTARIRRASPELSLSDPPTSIRAGTEELVTVTATEVAAVEDALLFDVTVEGQPELRAVSLYPR